jgi:hypothetical protein
MKRIGPESSQGRRKPPRKVLSFGTLWGKLVCAYPFFPWLAANKKGEHNSPTPITLGRGRMFYPPPEKVSCLYYYIIIAWFRPGMHERLKFFSNLCKAIYYKQP